MAGSITAYATAQGKRYRVRYRKPDKSQTDKRGFKTKREAELFLASTTVSKATGDYIDPALSKVTVGQLAPRWLAGKKPPAMKQSSYAPIERALRVHVEQQWGTREVGSIVPSEVQEWVTDLAGRRSATVTLRALGILAGILDMAIADGRIKKNPARRLPNRPRKPKKKTGRVYLSHEQVDLLASVSLHPTIVLTLAYTGLRWGELAGLRVRDVNQVRRRLHAEENAVTVDGIVHVGTLKGAEDRWVPYPAFLSKRIDAQLVGKSPRDLLFPDKNGQHLRRVESATGWFEGAISRAQLVDEHFPRITPHDLRHTAASLSISSGANVKVLQKMLGHESAAMTLDTYGDLFDDDLESVAVKLDEAARAAGVGKTWANDISV